jgi:hypothetical protein
MYKTIAGSLFFLTGEALAHPGHGAPELHSHAWEYALLAATVVAVVAIFAAKK